MKIKLRSAIFAGVVGTVLFDIAGFLLTGTFWDIPTLLSSKLFDGAGIGPGVIAHYANGIMLALIYGALYPSLWGGRVTKALTFVTVETVFGVWLFMLPLLGAGPLGLKMGLAIPFITLGRHWAYGLALAWLYPKPVGLTVNQDAALASDEQAEFQT